MPARYDASENPNAMPARFGPAVVPEVVMIDGLRKFRRDSLGGVLILEAVSEDERVALSSVLTEIILEFCRGFRLDVADLRAEAVANPGESLIGAAVPRLVGDRAGRQERDLEGRMMAALLAVGSDASTLWTHRGARRTAAIRRSTCSSADSLRIGPESCG